MAGYRDVNSASQTVRRNLQALDLQQENRNALECVLVAMAAGGRVGEMALIAQTLEKVNTNADLGKAISELTTVVQGIKSMNPPKEEVVDTYKTDMAAGLAAIGDRLNALEGK